MEKSFDQKDQIIALTTKIATLEKQVSSTPAAPTAAHQPSGGPKRDTDKKEGFTPVEAWRADFKGIKTVHEGKTWHWCTKGHKLHGKETSGLYVTHVEADHDFWKKYNNVWGKEKSNMMDEYLEAKKRKRAAEEDGGQTASTTTSKRMVMDPKMKEAFCTQSGMSESQVEAILDKYDPK